MVSTFDYTPSRDGLALRNGTSGIWQPRFPTEARAKGGDNIYNGEFEWYADPAYPWSNGFSPFAIDGAGNLRIRAQKTADLGFQAGEIPNDPATGAPYGWMSGILTSAQAFSQEGGYFEAEIQFPKGTGSFPAFWLLPLGAHPPEIDIAEYRGQLPNQYHVNAIGVAGQDDFYTPDGTDLSVGFHKYGLSWTDTTLTFYLDGSVVATKAVGDRPEFGQPFYVLLNLAVGTRGLGGFIPPPDNTTPDPMDMLVRSVRAWQRQGPTGLRLSATSYLNTLAVGGTVATILADSFGGDTAFTFANLADPDGAYDVSGNTLIKRASIAGASHTVRLQVTDSARRTDQRLFTLTQVSSGGTNLLPTSDLTSSAWNKEGTTAPSANVLMETAAGGGHDVILAFPVSKPAGAMRFTFTTLATPNLGDTWLQVQVFAGNGTTVDYGTAANAWFNMAGGSVGYTSTSGSWSGLSATITPLVAGQMQVQFTWTAGSESGLVPLIRLAKGQDQTSFAGNANNGMTLDSISLSVAQ